MGESSLSSLVFLLLLFKCGVYFMYRCYNKQRKRDKFYAALQICPFAGRYKAIGFSIFNGKLVA